MWSLSLLSFIIMVMMSTFIAHDSINLNAWLAKWGGGGGEKVVIIINIKND